MTITFFSEMFLRSLLPQLPGLDGPGLLCLARRLPSVLAVLATNSISSVLLPINDPKRRSPLCAGRAFDSRQSVRPVGGLVEKQLLACPPTGSFAEPADRSPTVSQRCFVPYPSFLLPHAPISPLPLQFPFTPTSLGIVIASTVLCSSTVSHCTSRGLLPTAIHLPPPDGRPAVCLVTAPRGKRLILEACHRCTSA